MPRKVANKATGGKIYKKCRTFCLHIKVSEATYSTPFFIY